MGSVMGFASFFLEQEVDEPTAPDMCFVLTVRQDVVVVTAGLSQEATKFGHPLEGALLG